jgi:hypothetical protein
VYDTSEVTKKLRLQTATHRSPDRFFNPVPYGLHADHRTGGTDRPRDKNENFAKSEKGLRQ